MGPIRTTGPLGRDHRTPAPALPSRRCGLGRWPSYQDEKRSADRRPGVGGPIISAMRVALLRLGAIAAFALLLVASHLALIEVGREVVTLRTQRPDGSWQSTRLWAVDDAGAVWLHSAGAAWARRFEGDPIVELKRGGVTRRYRAHPVPGPHPRIDALLRQKYGIADRWVRFIAPDTDRVLVVRLDPL